MKGASAMTDGVFAGPAGAQYPGRAVTKTEHAYDWIRERILSGELEPGQSLDPEALTAALGVSTTPLREAMRWLESEHLVVSRVHRDTVVAPIEYETLEEVFTIRLELEPLATRLAAVKGTDDEIAAIVRLVKEPPSSDDALTLLRYNGAIHRQIYRASHNAILVRTLDSLSDLVDRYRALVFRRDPGVLTAHRSHTSITDAIAARDADLAARLMREHVEYGFEQMRAAQPRLDGLSV